MNFTHLHVHSSYSLMDGYSHPDILAARAKELGMNALALTDHNHLLGAPEFKKACKENNIKPILGYEAYYTLDNTILAKSAEERLDWAMEQARKLGPERGFDFDSAYYDLRFPWNKKGTERRKEQKVTKSQLNELLADYLYDTTQYHLILLAKNQKGWQNIVKLQSESARMCTYNGRYLCDINLLRKYSEGVICSTACIGSYFAQKFIEGNHAEATRSLDEFRDVFGDDFYIELQPLNNPDQCEANFFLMRYAIKNNVKMIATNDVHYAMKDDYQDHAIMVDMGWGKTINSNNDNRESVYTHDFWLRSYDEMIETFASQYHMMYDDLNSKYFIDEHISNNYMRIIREALENTNHIADQVENIELGSPVPLFPKTKVPEGYTDDSYLASLCISAVFEYKKENPQIDIQKYFKRLLKELRIIKKKGFAPYFLTVYNYVNYCKQNKIPVGPGRGSASGSLCLYMLKITSNIDPIKYDLSFERFLTEDRTSPPDVDLDFAYSERPNVIKFLQEDYGVDFVASIGTVSVFGVKSGLKDVCRYYEIPFGESNAITAKFDEWFDKPDLSFKDVDNLAESDDAQDKQIYSEYKELENKYPDVFRLARKFEGIAKNVGIHASGVLITPVPINDVVPTRVVDGLSVTLYSGTTLEKLNFVKMDILGLKNLDIISNSLKLINPTYSYYDIYHVVKDDDEDTYKLIRRKESDGLFQLESDLFKHTIGEMQPNSLNDIAALNAICRPGPLSAGLDAQYNNTKNGKQDLVEPLRNTLDIVKDTYGAIIYQEQLMAISVKACGFNANQSDSITRKITAKKDKKKLPMLRRIMIWGKKNIEGPDGWQDDNNSCWYDPNAEYGDEICGAISKGYAQDEIERFFEMILGFADYCFNKSHAMCYGYLGYITAYLKTHYPLQFMASLLSMQTEQEKIDNYIGVSRSLGIEVKAPDINKSKADFSISDNSIYYGFGAIKSVGTAAIPNIIENQPYNSFEDFYERTNHSLVKKNVITNLILTGCFKEFCSNPHVVLSDFVSIKKLKDDDPLYIQSRSEYNKDVCIGYEKELLGTSISYVSVWNQTADDTNIEIEGNIIKLTERPDKKGKLMAFIDIISEGSNIRALVFSSKYKNLRSVVDLSNNETKFIFRGKKKDKNTIIIEDILRKENEIEESELGWLLEA